MNEVFKILVYIGSTVVLNSSQIPKTEYSNQITGTGREKIRGKVFRNLNKTLWTCSDVLKLLI